MAGDYTKFSFKHKKNYSGVYKQQGRVSLDSDWNEQSEIEDRRWRSETIDIIGKCVVPSSTPEGFQVIPTIEPGTFNIGIGRAYVDGIQAECHGLDPQCYDPVLGEEQGTLPVPYNDQPYLPAPLPTALSSAGDTDLIYLDVWQREVTVIEDPGLKEIALGGPDTTTRIQTAWQVKAIIDVGDNVSCLGAIDSWDELTLPSGGRLTTSTQVPPPDDNPCSISAAGGYRGLENRLYRLEIHTPGPLGIAKFKWSRNNASVMTSVTAINTDQITVESIGRDDILRFNVGDWVEITDDYLEFQSLSGQMGKITNIDEANLVVTINSSVQELFLPDSGITDPNERAYFFADRHTRLRRWDQSEDLDSKGLLTVPDNPTDMVDIEDGIRVSFDLDPTGGEFKIGDYWVFYARIADGSVELLEDAPPRGIKHHYCRLALVTWSNDNVPTIVDDCRIFWPPVEKEGCCTAVVHPGESIQSALDSLPDTGGCVCLKTGVHEIRTPLEIHASHIKLHGESPGVIVSALTTLPYLLEIGRADRDVSDIEVLSIRFEVSPQPKKPGVVLYLNHCAEVRVAQCELDVVSEVSVAYIGILMQGVRDVVVTGNRLNNMFDGIWVSDYLDRLVIEYNHIAGVCISIDGVDSSFGEYGIRIENDDFVVPCHIEHNHIYHFWMGVLLGDRARNSSVSNNQFLRLGEQYEQTIPTTIDELRDYLDDRYYAIDIEAEHCRIEGNLINLAASHWGGIRTRAEHTLIADNTLRATCKASPSSPMPGSIYCYGLADVGNAADHSRVSNNTLVGPQTGIIISRVNEVTVEDNFVDGMGAGWFGVRGANCNNVRVCGNTVEDIFFGIYLSGGLGNHVCDNHMTLCGMGISSVSENYLEVSCNDVVACLMTGIVLEVVATAKAIENRLVNCGYSGFASLGLAIFTEHVFLESESMVRIEGNEVLDTGVNPFTNKGTDTRAISIGCVCASCHISHNHTNYSQNVLDVLRQHRALMLIGPIAFQYDVTDNVTLEWIVGSAVVTDNRFRGPGRSYLVDFFPVIINDFIDFRFEKVTFNNNICEHLSAEPQEDAATVRLWGRNLIAMGNQVKADFEVNAMSLGNRNRVALMGNITTGGFIQVGTTTPAPLTDFNIRT